MLNALNHAQCWFPQACQPQLARYSREKSEIITVKANAANFACYNSNQRPLTPLLFILPLSALPVCHCQSRGYFAWRERPFETTADYLNSRIFPNMWMHSAFKSSTTHTRICSETATESRHSLCDSHHLTVCDFFELNDACSYLISAALSLAWPRFSFYSSNFLFEISQYNTRFLSILICLFFPLFF